MKELNAYWTAILAGKPPPAPAGAEAAEPGPRPWTQAFTRLAADFLERRQEAVFQRRMQRFWRRRNTVLRSA